MDEIKSTQQIKCPCCGHEIEMTLEVKTLGAGGSSIDNLPFMYEDEMVSGGGGANFRGDVGPVIVVKKRPDWSVETRSAALDELVKLDEDLMAAEKK